MKKIYRIKKVSSIPFTSFSITKRKQEEQKHSSYSDRTPYEEFQKENSEEEQDEQPIKKYNHRRHRKNNVKTIYGMQYYTTRNTKLYEQLNANFDTKMANEENENNTSVQDDYISRDKYVQSTNAITDYQKNIETGNKEAEGVLTKKEEMRMFKDAIKISDEEKETSSSVIEEFKKALIQRKRYEAGMLKGFKFIRGKDIETDEREY